LTADGWLHTGDVAVMDESGYFQVVDRLKDMVNVSGLKVYTTEVDEIYLSIPPSRWQPPLASPIRIIQPASE